MAGASAEGEVNHWPAFVDVLTTVIMVVTFLLVIMSAAVMVLSQRAIQKVRETVLAEVASAARGGHLPAAPDSGTPRAGGAGPARERLVSPADAEAGSSIAELGAILKSANPVNGAERLSIRTRETKDTLALKVKAVEQPASDKGVEVKTADTLVRVSFEPGALNYDPDNAGKVVAFLKAHPGGDVHYEVWSFAPQTGSISEAQRQAYFRAAVTRNLLVRAGIVPANISTQTRITDPKAPEGHYVRIVVKP